MLLLLACTAKAPTPEVRDQAWADGSTLRDADGRELVLHGINARVEGLFDVTFADGRTALEVIPPFGAEDCAFIADTLGMNLLRLPLNWSGMEPEDDAWNEAYFDATTTLVDACWAEGVYTLLNLHQDAYSKEIGEDGAPLWAIVPTPDELLEGPLDDLEARRTSPAVLAAFASLYADADDLHAKYGDMATELASRFVGHPGVVGLELQNEPVVLGNQDALDAFHAAIADDVRAVAPEMTLYFEPDSLRNLTDAAPVGEVFPLANAVYAPHIYTDVFENGWEDQDTAAVFDSVSLAKDEADDHGTPLFVGEFGHDPETELGLNYIATTLAAMDSANASWAFWLYEEWSQGRWGLYDGESEARGELRPAIVATLQRPYPMAISGDLVGFAVDETLRIEMAGTGEHMIAVPGWGAVGAACDGARADVVREGARARIVCEGSVLEVWSE